jgi:hypothetical protein
MYTMRTARHSVVPLNVVRRRCHILCKLNFRVSARLSAACDNVSCVAHCTCHMCSAHSTSKAYWHSANAAMTHDVIVLLLLPCPQLA